MTAVTVFAVVLLLAVLVSELFQTDDSRLQGR
jgi:hypothetical protein